jgi:hypothetical protein
MTPATATGLSIGTQGPAAEGDNSFARILNRAANLTFVIPMS